MARPTVEDIVERLDLAPLPVEGGLFRQTWVGEAGPDGRPVGTAIVVLLAADRGQFSALHRLPIDETWYFQLGDPIELLLLEPNIPGRVILLGPNVLGRHELQVTVPAGTWMGARVAPGGAWSLFATSMAPGFLPSDYEGGDPDELVAAWPEHEPLIRALTRPSEADARDRPPGR
jgi:predicted cupin superfamily sugar epimerase